MPDIQKIILEFLDKQTEVISLTELSNQLEISYPSILKHCDILFAEGKIDIKDYGNVKLVSKKDGQRRE